MKVTVVERWMRVLVPGAVLMGLGGCLGPNPGFFITSAAANATIMNLVNAFLNGTLGAGGP